MLKRPVLFAMRTVSATIALFALLGFRAIEAHPVTTEILLHNDTGLMLSSPVVTEWRNQDWSACGSSSNGPPATIAPGETVCLGTSNANSGLLPHGTGGTITYSIDTPQVTDRSGNPLAAPTDKLSFTWVTPWTSAPPVNAGGWGCSARVSSCFNGSCSNGNDGALEDTFASACVEDRAGSVVRFEVKQSQATASFAIDTASGRLSGAYGDRLSLVGSNIAPSAEVFFGSAKATVSCPSSTGCSVRVPLNTGVVPVTLLSYGAATAVGDFSYLGTPNGHFSVRSKGTSAAYAQGGTTPAADRAFVSSLNSAGAREYIYD